MREQIRVLRRVIGVGLLVWMLFVCGHEVFAFEVSENLPEEVVVVRNEKEMIQRLLDGMHKHKTCFAFYYEGIGRDFRTYRRQSATYQTFLDRLAGKDGYLMGTVSGSCISVQGTTNQYVTIQFGYLTTKKQEKKIDRKVRRIVRKIGKGSRIERITRAHDYLIGHMCYKEGVYNPYDAICKGKGMCMGYALAFQRIMQEMKIPCLYVRGKDHAWNLVKIGRYWYNIDTTWDDRTDHTRRYFLKSDKDFPGHKRPSRRIFKSLRMAPRSYGM